ncbi:MAG: TIGR00159 family protein [Deltaproteobacteria bacterium]|nr:TIGR00159 family protein [Deltaproteobacteria bacterium]
MFDILLRLHNIVEVIDIIIVAVVIYWLMLMFKGSKAERMLWGLGVIIIVYFVSQRVELLTLHWILSNFLGSIIIFIIVVFQQDIRRALVQMGKPFSTADIKVAGEYLDEITKAVSSMSRKRTGALIALERSMDLGDYLEIGVEVDSRVTKELLLSIFDTASPLHDGAAVVRKGRIFKAGCILPLTEREVRKSMGTRHRAAIGLAEETDAVIIVVSEETGEITFVAEDAVNERIEPAWLLGELKRLFPAVAAGFRQYLPWRFGQ